MPEEFRGACGEVLPIPEQLAHVPDDFDIAPDEVVLSTDDFPLAPDEFVSTSKDFVAIPDDSFRVLDAG